MTNKLPFLTPLDKRVLRRLGGGPDAIESAKDAANHGADDGFRGFIYHTETSDFVKRNRRAILTQLEADADDQGITVSELLKSFRCLKYIKDPMLAVAKGVFHEDHYAVCDALAWYALESCGRKLVDA
jgi:hypothetical protein